MTKDMEDALLTMHSTLTQMGKVAAVLMQQYRITLETNDQDIIDAFCQHMQKAVDELERLVP